MIVVRAQIRLSCEPGGRASCLPVLPDGQFLGDHSVYEPVDDLCKNAASLWV
jgi:hypothetical protein